MKEDLEFARRTEKAWREIEQGKFTEYTVEEYFSIFDERGLKE